MTALMVSISTVVVVGCSRECSFCWFGCLVCCLVVVEMELLMLVVVVVVVVVGLLACLICSSISDRFRRCCCSFFASLFCFLIVCYSIIDYIKFIILIIVIHVYSTCLFFDKIFKIFK